MLSPSWKRIKIIAFGEPNYLDGRMHHQALLNNLLAVWACLAFISDFLVLLIVLHTSLLLLMNPRTIKMDFCSDHHSLLRREFDRAYSAFGIQLIFSCVSGREQVEQICATSTTWAPARGAPGLLGKPGRLFCYIILEVMKTDRIYFPWQCCWQKVFAVLMESLSSHRSKEF